MAKLGSRRARTICGAHAPCFEYRRRVAFAIAAIGVGLQDRGPGAKMGPWMFGTPVARIMKQPGGRIDTAELGHRPAACQYRSCPWRGPARLYRRRAIGRRGGLEARSTMDGHERECGRANLVGERRQAERHSFTRETPGPGGLMAKASQVAAIEVDPVIRPPASVCPVALRVQGYRTSYQFDHTRRSPTTPASATRRKPSRGLPHPWAQAHPHQTYTQDQRKAGRFIKRGLGE